MLSIGNKKYRNLQEQVGYSSECIEKIFEVLDGLNIQDNVVVVPDISYILSEQEIEIVRRAVAFIVYDGQLYIKRSEDASLAYFDVVFSITLGTAITFNSKEIQVTLSNGALGIVTNTASTYSTTQIDTKVGAKADTTYVDAQLALKANLSGANFTGAVKASTLEQDQANYEQIVELNPANASLTLTNVYNRFMQIGNVLYIIANFRLKNETGSTVTIGANNSIASRAIEMSSADIAGKIYDVEGNTVAQSASSGNVLITAFCSKLSTSKTANGNIKELVTTFNNRSGAKNCSIYIYNDSNAITLNDGDEVYIFTRAPLTLL